MSTRSSASTSPTTCGPARSTPRWWLLRRILIVAIVLVVLFLVLMSVPRAREIGISLFASAGVAGLVVGMAARPALSNLIAGVQIAMTGPINIDDVVIMEGEWGRIEEIGSTYVVVRIWDERRLVVPLSRVIETPFQNWTRRSGQHLRHGVRLCRLHRARRGGPRQAVRDCRRLPELGRPGLRPAGHQCHRNERWSFAPLSARRMPPKPGTCAATCVKR